MISKSYLSLLEIFRTLAGYSYGRADVVRRLMSKKKSELMSEQGRIFVHGETDDDGNVIIPGAIALGMNEKDAMTIFEEMEGFAKYAFNKSHAACYAFVTYRTAYLKCHYYAEYMASLLTNELGNLEKTAFYISLCKRKGISVLPPDVNESDVGYTVIYDENGKPRIRYGLLAIKNVGVNFTSNIIEERKEKKFSDLQNFISRMVKYDSNRKQMEALIKCGAFDSFGVYRSQMLASYDTMMENQLELTRGVVSGQMDLFGDAGGGALDQPFEYPDIPEFSIKDRLLLEKEAAGMYFSGHMLDDYSKNIADLKPVEISTLIEKYSDETGIQPDKAPVTVCGTVSARTDKNTKSGGVMSFVTLEGRYSSMEILVFPKILENCRQYLLTESAIAVSGTLSKREEEPVKMLAERILPLVSDDKYVKRAEPVSQNIQTPKGEYVKKSELTMYIKVNGLESYGCTKAKQYLDVYTDESSTACVRIYDTVTGKYYKRDLPVTLTPGLIFRLKKLLGSEAVVLK